MESSMILLWIFGVISCLGGTLAQMDPPDLKVLNSEVLYDVVRPTLALLSRLSGEEFTAQHKNKFIDDSKLPVQERKIRMMACAYLISTFVDQNRNGLEILLHADGSTEASEMIDNILHYGIVACYKNMDQNVALRFIKESHPSNDGSLLTFVDVPMLTELLNRADDTPAFFSNEQTELVRYVMTLLSPKKQPNVQEPAATLLSRISNGPVGVLYLLLVSVLIGGCMYYAHQHLSSSLEKRKLGKDKKQRKNKAA